MNKKIPIVVVERSLCGENIRACFQPPGNKRQKRGDGFDLSPGQTKRFRLVEIDAAGNDVKGGVRA